MRGWGRVEPSCGVPFLWKRCETAACPRLVCIGVSRTLCFVCSGATREQLDRRWGCEGTDSRQ